MPVGFMWGGNVFFMGCDVCPLIYGIIFRCRFGESFPRELKKRPGHRILEDISTKTIATKQT